MTTDLYENCFKVALRVTRKPNEFEEVKEYSDLVSKVSTIFVGEYPFERFALAIYKGSDIYSAFDEIADFVMNDEKLKSPYGRIAALYTLLIVTSSDENYGRLAHIVATRTAEFGGWDWDKFVKTFKKNDDAGNQRVLNFVLFLQSVALTLLFLTIQRR